MSIAPEKTPEDVEAAFRAAPETMVAEIIDGELHLHARPARPHARTASRLMARLGRFDDDGDPGGWVILVKPEIHLGPRPDKMVLELAGWRRERMPDALGADDAPYFYDLAPDWVCEIVSPSTERLDRGAKMRVYRREGVRNAWLVNPIAQTLEVYRLEADRWVLLETYEGDSVVRPEPFDALDLPLATLWAR